MFVDPAMLTEGASHSRSAADHAQAGASALEAQNVTAGIFGNFGSADVFHQAISTSHGEHLDTLLGHRRTLTDVTEKAHHAREAFTEMDQSNAAQLHAVRCNSAT